MFHRPDPVGTENAHFAAGMGKSCAPAPVSVSSIVKPNTKSSDVSVCLETENGVAMSGYSTAEEETGSPV